MLEVSPGQVVRSGSVLLVSGDRPWLASATAFLVADTRTLSTAETAAEAIDMAMSHPPDVVVIAPPIEDGSPLLLINQLTTLRSRGRLGIVYVSDREREMSDHVKLMRAGTNDWFPRGIAPSEAARRVSALLAEIVTDPQREVIRGPLRMDLESGEVLVGGARLDLSVAEYRILRALALATGRLMTQRELMEAARLRRGSRTAGAVGNQVERLRDKLGAARGLLECSRRDGFRLRFVAPP